MLIFDSIRKMDRDNVDNYKTIMKCETLRDKVKAYLYDFSQFIHFEMKTPKNFIKISEKFQILNQDTKTLHSIFKRNAEANYQLLLLRYIYETALHSRIKTFHNDLYTLILITVRIIRTYFNETLLSNDVDKVFNYFSAMIIGYLVINLFLEVTIFLILNFFVISRIKVLNRKVMKFIYSLRF